MVFAVSIRGSGARDSGPHDSVGTVLAMRCHIAVSSGEQTNGDSIMLRLWGRPSSARTQKVLWTLSEIGLDFDFILASATMGQGGHVSKGNTPFGVVDTPEYRALNPNGRVPTIDDDGFILWESNSIVRYLAMRYAPDLLYGNDVKIFASASRWLDWENNELIPPQHELVMHLIRLPEEQRDAKELEHARLTFIKALRIINEQLGLTRFMTGDRFTYGDIAIGIRVHRWYLLDIDKPAMPNVERFYHEIQQRPAFHKWTADPSHHLDG
jgi:glutathione S-transferase